MGLATTGGTADATLSNVGRALILGTSTVGRNLVVEVDVGNITDTGIGRASCSDRVYVSVIGGAITMNNYLNVSTSLTLATVASSAVTSSHDHV